MSVRTRFDLYKLFGVVLVCSSFFVQASDFQSLFGDALKTEAVESETTEQKTVAKDLSLTIGDALDQTKSAQAYAVSDVLFVPLNQAATAKPWLIKVDGGTDLLRGSISAVQLIAEANGAISEIKKLSSVSLSANAELSIAIPSSSTHLELAVSEQARILLTNQNIDSISSAETIKLGEWMRASSSKNEWRMAANFPPKIEGNKSFNIQAAVSLPDNYGASLSYVINGKVVKFPSYSGRFTLPVLPSDKALNEVVINFSREKVFANDPWPDFLLKLDSTPLDDDEREPNDKIEVANSLDWNTKDRRVRRNGSLTVRDPDLWQFTIDPERAKKGLGFKVDFDDERGSLSLLNSKGEELASASGSDKIGLENVVLPEGDYFLRVSSILEFVEYSLSARAGRMPKANEEREPNGLLEWSQELDLNTPLKGKASGDDKDIFRFQVTEPGRLFGLQVSNGAALSLKLPSGEVIQRQGLNRNGDLTRLAGQQLPIGNYVVEVSNAARYSLLLRDLGPVADDFEKEPNNTYFEGTLLEIGQSTRGGFGAENDRENISFTIETPQHVRIQIEAPDDTEMRASLLYKSTLMVGEHDYLPGQMSDQVFFLQPGDYSIALSRLTKKLSRDLWRVVLERPDFSASFETEPNATAPVIVGKGERIIGNQFGLDPYDSYLIQLPDESGKVFYGCNQLQGTEVDVGILPKGTRWTGKGLRYQNMVKHYRFDEHDGSTGSRYSISHRAFGAGEDGYDCSAHWDTDDTRSRLIEEAPLQKHPLASRAGFSIEDRLSLPTRVAYKFNGPSQNIVHRLDLPPGTQQLTVQCEGTEGYLYIHTSDGKRLGSIRHADQAKTVDVSNNEHLYIRGWANNFNKDGPTISCALQAGTEALPIESKSDKGPTKQVFSYANATMNVSIDARIATALLPGELGERISFDLIRDHESFVSASCLLPGNEGREEKVVERMYRLEPGKPENFRPDFRVRVDNVEQVMCSVIDLQNLPMLPLGQSAITLASPKLELTPPIAPFAALIPHAQRQLVELSVTNPNNDSLDIGLSAAINSAGWQVTDIEQSLTLQAGETKIVNIGIEAPANQGTLRPVDLLVTASSSKAPTTRKDVLLPVKVGVSPATPKHFWRIPDVLAGGINVAWSSLGGIISALDDKPLREAQNYMSIVDGNAPRIAPKHLDGASSFTIDLAGDAPVPIAGFTYTVRPQTIDVNKMASAIDVSVSQNGVDFQLVESFSVSTTALRQIFSFKNPVSATHVRIESSQCVDRRYCLPVTELAVVADPSWGREAEGLGEFNIADPALGGIIVGTDLDGVDVRTVLTEENTSRISPPELEKGEEPPESVGNIVIGFHRARAPKLDRIEWNRPKDLETDVPYVTVALGNRPMTPDVVIGKLQRPDAGEVATLKFPEDTTARYVFITLPYADTSQYAPQNLRIIESKPNESYRSILGMWEEDDPRSYSDWIKRINTVSIPDEISPIGGTEAKPYALSTGQSASSVTWKETSPDWYLLPGDAATSEPAIRLLQLNAPEIVEVGPTLFTEDGEKISFTLLTDLIEQRPDLEESIEAAVAKMELSEASGDSVIFAAQVDPSKTHRLKIAEEGRLLILRREVTDMLLRDEPVRRNAYRDLASLMGDGKDGLSINLPGRDGDLILRGKEEILFAMSRVPEVSEEEIVGTSDFGKALADDAKRLRGWPGGKGIVYYGMGAGMAQLDDLDWVYRVEEVPARTSSIVVSCDDGNFFCPEANKVEPYPMHFAAALGGRFFRAVSRYDIRDGLLNAAYALQGPKPYTVSWLDIPAPPAPATISLIADLEYQNALEEANEVKEAPALALVLDASGSMLQMLDGKRRIVIAKESLRKLVNESIPEAIQVSFRAFGLEVDGCRTEQLAKLAPLDRDTLNAAINSVEAINLAKTPIAKSLEAAARDLANAKGERSIILLTDGEETCGGSVEETLAQLEQSGLSSTLHIVGFAIDDSALKTDFERWSSMTGGVYLDAKDGAGLETAITEAVAVAVAPPVPTSATISSLDTEEEGSVLSFGESISLKAGRYSVTLNDGKVIEVELSAGQSLEIGLADFL